MKKINILVFPCGSEIALEVYKSLNCQKDINLIGVSSVSDHGKFVYENYIGGAPLVSDPNFVKYFQQIIKKNSIDFIYPCMDIVIDKFKFFENEFSCKIIGSPKETTEICNSKLKTYNYFKNIINTPKVYHKSDDMEFPIFSKPEIGASSRGTVKIENLDDLNYWTKKMPANLLLEYLPGEEYTIDCFTSKNGELKFIGPRKRGRINNGISVNTIPVIEPQLEEMAHKINKNLKLNGSWFFQAKKDKNEKFSLLEIATRFGGSSLIHRILGINFAYLNILNEIYSDIQILKNNFNIEIDRSLDIKANLNINFNKVYIDFDDTIIINDQVNINLIKLIYKFLNQNKKIILITKHAGNITESLEKYKINLSIFDKIIHLNKNEEKYKYIENDSIFIDDSFSERKKVFDNLNIPVFSVENIEIL